ncbi:cysteine dioxygenase family protein [Actinoallomurus purpureus]|uniref:cysteine dioxygenase family protein n=1 Tax=Actinoallomurus purpureus TaxID=478114 RepID=UPI0020925AAF|nr:cysteine dioxygenase family protein [Actinoallomurus purpureus]MCO6006022.1 cysteine dioxygenase family protein [Actinoallomurus purpureus]
MTLVLGTVRPGLDDLVTGVRSVVDLRADWRETARRVAAELRRHMPTPDMLTAEERIGDPDRYVSHTLYVEPGGMFSLVGLVWRPGQVTPIHDHVTWCVFGVLQGVEHEELYVERGDHLVQVGVNDNHVGEVSGFAPPGDIHRVRNSGDGTAISLHIYGTDISRVDSSVRRCYDLPVRD